MATKIFVNLPVKDLSRSMDFFSKLGFTNNPNFTDDKAASMVISEDIYLMLLTAPFFQTFTKKEIADTTKSIEVINCLSADSKEAVNDLVNKAFAAGATTHNEKQDHGFVYIWGFQDLDGHLWEIMHMDMTAMPHE